MDNLHGAAESEVNVKSNRIGPMVESQLGHVQAKLVGFNVEIPQTVVAGTGMIEIYVVVAIDKATEIYATN
jgi:hypothetical protein